MNESLSVKILYGTVPGRVLLKMLVSPWVSRVAAHFLSSGLSKWIIPVFIRKNGIDMSCYEIPEGGFASFNDFFTRKKKEEYIVRDEAGLVSPCDGLLTVAPIDDGSVFYIKNTSYSLKELLCDEKRAEYFTGGTALIFRLTAAHYHRYCFAASGVIRTKRRIRGVLHSVQPICHEKEKVFVENSREYVVIHNENLGRIVQMEIGALLVGRISNEHVEPLQKVRSGQEKGHFEFGGSSIVVLLKDKAELPDEMLQRAGTGQEIPVVAGEMIIR